MAHYLLLVVLTKDNAPSIERLQNSVKSKIDPKATMLWSGGALLGLIIETDLRAYDVWQAAIRGTEELRDVLVIEVGRDWIALDGTKMAGWLNSHFGPPLPPTRLR